MANTGSDWFAGNAAFFVKIGTNKSGMPPEFCLFVFSGKEMLLYFNWSKKTKPRFTFVFVRVTSTQQEVHRTQRTQNRLSKWRLLAAKTTQVV